MIEPSLNDRVKLFRVREEEIVTTLSGVPDHQYVRFYKTRLPPNSRIVGAEWRIEYRAFLLVVWNEEFPPVPPGQLIPIADEFSEVEVIEVRRADLPLPRPATVVDMKSEINRLLNELRDRGETIGDERYFDYHMM